MSRKRSIRRTLSATLLTLATMPLFILGGLLIWHSFSIQQQQAIDFQQEISKRAATKIQLTIDELENNFFTLANIYNFTEHDYTEQSRTLSRLQAKINDRHQNIITKITLVGSNGEELSKISTDEIFIENDLTSVAESPSYTIPLATGDVYFSSVWTKNQTGDPYLTMAVPWINARTAQLDAVVIIDLRLKELWINVMDMQVGKLGQIYIIDSTGRVIAHQNPSVVLRGTFFKSYKNPGFQKNIADETASLVAAEVVLGDQTLYVITDRPIAEALQLTITTLLTISLFLILTIFVCVALAYFMTRRIVIPIESLAETANAIATGDLTRRAQDHDYDEVSLLARSFNSMTTRLLDTIARLKTNIAQVDRLARYDALTHLPNRRLFEESLGKNLSSSRRHKRYGAVLFIDLDHFKMINDSLGHHVGDELLIHVAERLQANMRLEDSVARLGGDEFVVALNNISSDLETAIKNARLSAEKTCLLLAEPYELEGNHYRVTSSIGVAIYPNETDTVADVLKHADTAMYHSKDSGRDTIHFYNADIQRTVDNRLALEKEMHEAIKNREFILEYQPIINVNGKAIGVESLIRWNHPTRGTISPEHFIPLAEETGLIIPLGQWVLQEACATFVEINKKHKDMLGHIAVNISYRQFHQDTFIDDLFAILSATHMPPSCLTLEITESILMTDVGNMVIKINALKSLGIRFAIDDFGTGFSSLSYLSKLPLDILKIDRSFVLNLPYSKDGSAIVETVIDMANNLNLDIVAEGVENEEQLHFLQAKQCSYYQGYLFSKALEKDKLVTFMKQHNFAQYPSLHLEK